MSTTPSELRIHIIKDLKLKQRALPAKISDTRELELKLAQLIEALLKDNLPELMQILYRIDVDEQKVKKALITPFSEEAAENIARLIIQRLIQKIEIRKRYSNLDQSF
ncbi:MAG TPA: hypothetical protein VIK89_09080 [Cytophagaceae bacterium]